MRKAAAAEPEQTEQKPALVVGRDKREFYQQTHNLHRLIVPDGTSSEDIEGRDFLGAVRDKLSGGDLVYLFDESWRTFWQALAIGSSAHDALIGGTQIRLVILPNYPIELPEVDLDSTHDLPANYTIKFNAGTRRFIPFHGETFLNRDGHPQRELARQEILHHAQVVAS